MDPNKIKIESPEIEPEDSDIESPQVTAEPMLTDLDFESEDDFVEIKGGDSDVYTN